MTGAEETRAVAALLILAGRMVGEERAVIHPAGDDSQRRDDDGLDGEGLAIARRHGIDVDRLRAYQSLARSRGMPLADVLRAAFRGELRAVVAMPVSE